MRLSSLLIALLIGHASVPLSYAGPNSNVEANARLASTLAKDNKLDQALLLAEQTAKAEPNNAAAYLLLGRVHYWREESAPAIVALNRAIALDPTLARAWFFRGLSQPKQPTPGAALADLEQAARLNEQEASHWYELGLEHRRLKNDEQAERALKKSVALDRSNAPAWFYLGVLADRRGDYTAAESAWEAAMSIEPDVADVHYNLGQHHQTRGSAEKALTHFMTAAKLQPEEIDFNKKVVQAYYRLDNITAAQPYLTKVKELIKASADPAVRATAEICIDQFDAPGGRFFVMENLRSKGEFLHYHYVFRLDKDGEQVKTINLESSPSGEKGETLFFLGMNVGNVHVNTGLAWDAIPDYRELKALVLKAHAGQLPARATTTYGAKSARTERQP